MRSALLAAAIGGLGLASAQTLTASPSNQTAPSSTPTGIPTDPCALIAFALNESSSSIIPAKGAYDCLVTVPVDVDGDVILIEELKTILQWQSNTAYLKDPPRQYGYKEEPVDLMGGLDLISQGVKNGSYSNEYAVQMDINLLLTKSYDNHLGFRSDISQVFSFFRPIALVSVSTDGVTLPEVYVFEDLNKTAQNGEKWTPAPVQSINGQDVDKYLTEYATNNAQYHDADVRYNALFPNQALLSTGSNVQGVFFGGAYSGPYTNLTFSNGTKAIFENRASVRADFDGVDSGEAFFSKFCNGPTVAEPTPAPTAIPTETPETASSTPEPPTPTPTGYPEPVFYDKVSLAIAGYYLEDAGFEHVAVLSLPAFESDSEGSIPVFQNVTRDLIADALSKGKTNLIIDLRGNGGGSVLAGFDIFKQLFPTEVPYGAGKMRAHDAFHYLGEATTMLVENQTLFTQLNDTAPKLATFAEGNYADFNYQVNVDINNTVFTSFEKFYGPHVVYNDTFSSIRRQNFEYWVDQGVSVSGYGIYANVSKVQPFATENITILQDGYCASTCTIFSELMREQGRVETVVIGGRPIEAPMQGIGGTKGSRVWPWSDINGWAKGLVEIADALHPATAVKLNNTVIGTLAYPKKLATRVAYDPTKGTPIGSVNAMDNLRQNDTTETPLEFIYEAADCKLFYTIPQIFDVREVWKAVASVQWGDAKCVANSTEDPTSISGKEKGPGNNPSQCGNGSYCNAAGKVSVPALAVVGVMMAMFL